MLFLRGVTLGSTSLGRGSNIAIWVKPAKGTVAFLEDATTFFEKRLDLIDELLLVELLLGGAVGFFNGLVPGLVSTMQGHLVVFCSETHLGDLLQDWLHLLQRLL